MQNKVNLAEKLALFSDVFSPRTIAQFNHHDVMLAKIKGDFVWHKHDDTDDFFLVLTGQLTISVRENGIERDIVLNPGELYIVPRGVEHKPFAADEAHILLIEPMGTPNTGDPQTAAPRQVI
jgi:mannose-6-phosphate isomerase-like protein (cupin superfamily)